MLDALATAAQHDIQATGAFVHGVSSSGSCTVNMRDAGAPSQLSYGHLVRAVTLFWTGLVMDDHRFWDLDWSLVYEGTTMSTVYIWQLPDPSITQGASE